MDRCEHPKPQFMRKNWQNLNGIWEFEIDKSNSGEDRGLYKNDSTLNSKINVPFCPESKLSGIADTDFLNSVWYRRKFNILKNQLEGRVVLHFGAVDYCTTVYINEKKCGVHEGGYSSFNFDITDLVNEGENIITIHAEDDVRNRLIPSGKQSNEFASSGCFYTRTTGIWQTVWLEFTPKKYIKSFKLYPNIDVGSIKIDANVCGSGKLSIEATFDGKCMGKESFETDGGFVSVSISLKEKHLWELGNGRLYDLKITFNDDVVYSYFGLRSIDYSNYKFLLNGKSVFQRLVLDQGFYPEGIYTAPKDEDLAKDIDLSMAMGFNGARLHEKVFEERFLYHCDRKGYIVWGEYPNWGLDVSYPDSIYGMLAEWLEVLERDFNHPSIVGWCPFNETWNNSKDCPQYDPVISLVYKTTKAIDKTRPCIDTSGHFHVMTDIYDLHDYEQNPEEFSKHYENIGEGITTAFWGNFIDRQKYDGKMPFFVSEYGGIFWSEDSAGWGYGNSPKTKEEFLSRLKGLNDVLLDNEKMFGLCYTQLTDVEQERNGLYTYNREPKFKPEEIFPLFARKAAIEK